MELTEAQKHLIAGLKCSGVSKGHVGMISVLLKTEEQQVEMIRFIVEHKGATEDELMDEAWKIAGNG